MKKEKTKFLRKDFLNSQRGITLIALVITIIVLLILAGVSLNLISGENGVLNQAKVARDRTNKEGIKEEIKLAYMSVQTDAIINGWNINKIAEELQKELRNEDKTATVTVKQKKLNIKYKSLELEINENGDIKLIEKSEAKDSTIYARVYTKTDSTDEVLMLASNVETFKDYYDDLDLKKDLGNIMENKKAKTLEDIGMVRGYEWIQDEEEAQMIFEMYEQDPDSEAGVLVRELFELFDKWWEAPWLFMNRR